MTQYYQCWLRLLLLFSAALVLSSCVADRPTTTDPIHGEPAESEAELTPTTEPTTSMPVAPTPTITGERDDTEPVDSRIEDTFASVVRIETDRGGGTGFAIADPDGRLMIVTNEHVIEGASAVRVIDTNNEAWSAIAAYIDPLVDLALLHVPGLQLPALALSNDSAELADTVWVLGYPLLLPGDPTITQGVISSRRQFNNVTYLQIDAALNPGNSGGPMLNEANEAIAVATWGFRDGGETTVEGIGFGIPSTRVESLVSMVAEDLIAARPLTGDVAISLVPPVQEDAPPEQSTIDEINRLISDLPGRSSAVVAYADGPFAERAPNQLVPAGSLIKLWIAAAALDDAAAGRLDLWSSYTIRIEDQAPGTGVINQPQYLGRSLTYGELIEIMLLYSDNSAANIITRRIGGFERVNQYASAAGYRQTRMQRWLGYLDPAAENYTSADDCTRFFINMLQGNIVDEPTSAVLRFILEERSALEPTNLNFFGRRLPSHATYAHVSGILPATRNEVGYIVTESGRLVVIALLLESLASEAVGEQAISALVGEIYYDRSN